MRTQRWARVAAVAWATAWGTAWVSASPATAGGQGLERQVTSAGDGQVQFHFAARDGVCGNGRSFYRVDEDGWYQSTSTGSYGNDARSDLCARGPVRVVVTRAGRETVRIETYAGPLATVADRRAAIAEQVSGSA